MTPREVVQYMNSKSASCKNVLEMLTTPNVTIGLHQRCFQCQEKEFMDNDIVAVTDCAQVVCVGCELGHAKFNCQVCVNPYSCSWMARVVRDTTNSG